MIIKMKTGRLAGFFCPKEEDWFSCQTKSLINSHTKRQPTGLPFLYKKLPLIILFGQIRVQGTDVFSGSVMAFFLCLYLV